MNDSYVFWYDAPVDKTQNKSIFSYDASMVKVKAQKQFGKGYWSIMVWDKITSSLKLGGPSLPWSK